MAEANWRATPIDDVLRRDVEFHADPRGSFGELWRSTWTRDVPRFVQSNLSRSKGGVVRGLHFHARQTDLWVILEGRAHVALVDLRAHLRDPRLSARPQVLTDVFAAGGAVMIPPGVAHGFWALDDLALLYMVTEEYDGSDEHGFAWNDPLAAVEWPSGEPTLSQRDRDAPSLAEVLRSSP